MNGSKEFAQRSKECLLDMMKASKLRGRAGQVGLHMATAQLFADLISSSWEHMGKPSCGRAEEILHEAQQVLCHVADGLQMHFRRFFCMSHQASWLTSTGYILSNNRQAKTSSK